MKDLLNQMNWKTAIYGMIFLLVLDISYATFMVDAFSKMGYTLDFKLVPTILMFPLVGFAGALLPKESPSRLVSHKFHIIFFFLAYIPILAYYSMGPTQEWKWPLGVSMFYPVTFTTRYLLENRKRKILSIVPPWSFPKWVIIGAAAALSIGTAVILLIYAGLPKGFNLVHVYDTRERLAMVPRWGNYLVNWTMKAALTFLIIYCIRHFKRDAIHKLGLVFTLFLVGSIFYLTGHKMLYVSILILLTFYVLLNRNWNFENSMFYIFSGLIVFGIISYYVGGPKIIPSLILRRSFILPARISFGYYDYFMDQKLYLSHSIFKYFISTDIPPDHAKIIASKYLNIIGPNSDSASANNGIFSDGFKNFGWIGIAIWSAVVSLILYFVDRIVYGKDHLLFVPLLLLSLMTWINSALLTVLLTHGVLLLLMLVLFYPKEKKEEDSS